jgi:hypothetical protein
MRKIICIIITALPLVLAAQTAERQVIGSAGDFANTASFKVSSTVGETITATGTSPSIILNQGFQSPTFPSTLGIEDVEMGFTMNAFPNPTRDAITLSFSTENELQLSIGLFDVQGKQVLPNEQLNVNGKMQHSIQMLGLATGNYFIRLTDRDGKLSRRIQIQKVD